MALLRKIKEKFRKLGRKEKKFKTAKKAALKETPKEKPKEALGVRETAVEKTKFSTPETPRISPRMLEELPWGYGADKIVLQVRDTRWIHAYWEITQKTLDSLKERLTGAFHGAKRVLRVYDVSQIIFDGKNAHRFFDIEVGNDASNWYVDTNGPGRSWCVDIGLRLASGEFIMIARSNTVYTPIEGPSWITDEEWMVPEDMFARLYGMGFGFGKSSPVGKAWQERVKRALFSGVLASPGITSVASPVKKQQARKFWLNVNTELIVYGATEADAKVAVQGKPVALRSDGTFSLRFALPDGKQAIPVEGVSRDGIDKITITPVVTKETK
ncbi:MAG: DUF4912 domain-containing protein [Candidatus Omnitrophota bacterium]|jgi:hypothetical protein